MEFVLEELVKLLDVLFLDVFFVYRLVSTLVLALRAALLFLVARLLCNNIEDMHEMTAFKEVISSFNLAFLLCRALFLTFIIFVSAECENYEDEEEAQREDGLRDGDHFFCPELQARVKPHVGEKR